MAMAKQALLAIRQKKTTTSSTHRDAVSDMLQELYRFVPSHPHATHSCFGSPFNSRACYSLCMWLYSDFEADLADRISERKAREAKAKKEGKAAAAPAKAATPAKTAAKKSTGPRTSCNVCFAPFADDGDGAPAIMSNCGTLILHTPIDLGRHAYVSNQ
jgi:hypothetical protein